MEPTPPADIPRAPDPWKCKATIYMGFFYQGKRDASAVPPEKLYSPLERASSFAGPEAVAGAPVGGLGSIQLVRYEETPVGAYDELVIAPGRFTFPVERADGRRQRSKAALRITRIYVSQRPTAWNGRYNWNVPKHLARFEWTHSADGGTAIVKVFPHDTASQPYDPAEPAAAERPFFQCTFKPMRYLPSFPLWTPALSPFLDLSLVQPPLPAGETPGGELVGTNCWRRCLPVETSPRACLGWFDLRQEGGENFWPGVGRWILATKMSDTTLEFKVLETWEVPKSSL